MTEIERVVRKDAAKNRRPFKVRDCISTFSVTLFTNGLMTPSRYPETKVAIKPNILVVESHDIVNKKVS